MRKITAFVPAILLVFALAAPGAQAATAVSYSTSGSYLTNDCSNQIDCTSTYSYTGSATCAENCLAGAPAEGRFTITLTATSPLSGSPCEAKRVEGSLQVLWSDATTTTASLTGRARDHKGYALEGTVTGGTNPFLPPGPPIKGFVSHPPSPCVAGSFTGSLAFYA